MTISCKGGIRNKVSVCKSLLCVPIESKHFAANSMGSIPSASFIVSKSELSVIISDVILLK